MNTLMGAIESCDRLNSWIRSESAKHAIYSAPSKAIYYIKGHLLNRALDAGLTRERLIVVRVKCRNCVAGKFYSWYEGQTDQTCRKCDGQGVHPLWFVESTIGRFVWHSPVRWGSCNWPMRRRIDLLGPAHEVSDWSPNTVGRSLEPWEVARDLNVVETFIGERPGRYWDDGGGPCDDFRYSLFVGDTARACFKCGSTDVTGLCCSRNAIAWHAWVCAKCMDQYGKSLVWSDTENRYLVPGGSVFDAVPFPDELVTHSEIRIWQARQLGYRSSTCKC